MTTTTKNNILTVTNPNENEFLSVITGSRVVKCFGAYQVGGILIEAAKVAPDIRLTLKRLRVMTQTFKGYHLYYLPADICRKYELKESLTPTPAHKTERKPRTHTDAIPIIAIDVTGNESLFPSVSQMCRCLGLDRGNVYRVMRGEWQNTKGYIFKYGEKIKRSNKSNKPK